MVSRDSSCAIFALAALSWVCAEQTNQQHTCADVGRLTLSSAAAFASESRSAVVVRSSALVSASLPAHRNAIGIMTVHRKQPGQRTLDGCAMLLQRLVLPSKLIILWQVAQHVSNQRWQ